jgi:hypothetical protein
MRRTAQALRGRVSSLFHLLAALAWRGREVTPDARRISGDGPAKVVRLRLLRGSEATSMDEMKKGDLVNSTTGFFSGPGEVLEVSSTRLGVFVEVEHMNGHGGIQKSLCHPERLKKIDTSKVKTP